MNRIFVIFLIAAYLCLPHTQNAHGIPHALTIVGKLFGPYAINVLDASREGDTPFRIASPSLALYLYADTHIGLRLSRFRVPQQMFASCETSWFRKFRTVLNELSDALAADCDNVDNVLFDKVLDHIGLPTHDALVVSRRHLMFFAYRSSDIHTIFDFVHTALSTIYLRSYTITPVVKDVQLYESWQRLAKDELSRLARRKT